MNVGELKKILAKFSDDVSVVIRTKEPTYDGSVELEYEDAFCKEETLSRPDNIYGQGFWDDWFKECQQSPIKVLLVTWEDDE
jgi:glycerophosphoryl diester phosphodiesterase